MAKTSSRLDSHSPTCRRHSSCRASMEYDHRPNKSHRIRVHGDFIQLVQGVAVIRMYLREKLFYEACIIVCMTMIGRFTDLENSVKPDSAALAEMRIMGYDD